MQIGWAFVDVTPDEPTVLRGQFHARISTHVNDPVTATVLALETSDEAGCSDQAILVSCDRVNVPGVIIERLREVLAPRMPGFDPGKLLMNATHTHTAPEVEERVYPPQAAGVMSPTAYADLFVARVADGIVQAWEGRAPGGVSWAYGHAVVGHNRRLTYADGSAQMYGDSNRPDFECVEGSEDPGVDMLFTWDSEHKLTGVVINLACPSQVTEGEYYVSADFWHEARCELHRRHGEGLFILPQCSAAGDQSPHLLVHKQAELEMLRRRGLTEREELGRRIANAVDDVLPLAAADIRTCLPFKHEMRVLELPTRMVTPRECEQSAARLEALSQESVDPADVAAHSRHFVMMRRARTVLRLYEQQQTDPLYRVETHYLRLGEIAMATNPFELFLDFGLRMKARSRAVQTFVVQLTSGGGKAGSTYLPTARALAGGSYGAEVVDNIVGPEGGQMLVEATVATINAMFEDETGQE